MSAALWAVLVSMLFAVESSNNLAPRDGDNGRAVGPLQIQPAVVADVNRIAGTHYTLEDRRDFGKSQEIAKIYLSYWAERYAWTTGREPTLEVYCRIWNGGPYGWNKKSTLAYWRKCQHAKHR